MVHNSLGFSDYVGLLSPSCFLGADDDYKERYINNGYSTFCWKKRGERIRILGVGRFTAIKVFYRFIWHFHWI